MLRALIVDDEYPARQELRFMLEQLKNVEIVGEAAGAGEALKLIQALDYDILFLDINLPGINGLELAEKLQKMPKSPHIIFITAYDQYALEAFDVNAVDYIIKPINSVRLRRAINRIEEKKPKCEMSGEKRKVEPGNTTVDMITNAFPLKTNKLIANRDGKLILVDADDVFFAYIRGDDVYLKTQSGEMHTKYSLKELETKLNKERFVRTHRSFIVNINQIKEIMPFFNGTVILVMKDKEKSEVPVSRNQVKRIRKIFE